MALTKNQIKWIQSLAQKKNRDAEGAFVAEGNKLVGDLLPLFHCRLLIATSDFLSSCSHADKADEVIETAHDDIRRASLLNAPQQVIGIFQKPQWSFSSADLKDGLTLMLDCIQDPGNLGTIIRIADWFGIKQIVCSKDTVDVYNPKVVQATMGAIGRVPVIYTDLADLLDSLNGNVPVYGTFLEGDNIYKLDLPQSAIVVMGNEGNGVSAEIKSRVNRKLFIPNYPAGVDTSESLNVAVATAITCSEFRRRTF